MLKKLILQRRRKKRFKYKNKVRFFDERSESEMSLKRKNKINQFDEKIKELKKTRRKLKRQTTSLKKQINELKEKEIGKKVKEMLVSESIQTPGKIEKLLYDLKQEMENGEVEGGEQLMEKIENNNKEVEELNRVINELTEKRKKEEKLLKKDLRKNRDHALYSVGGLFREIFKIDVYSVIENEVDLYFSKKGITPTEAQRNKRIKKVFEDLTREKIEELLMYKRKYYELTSTNFNEEVNKDV